MKAVLAGFGQQGKYYAEKLIQYGPRWGVEFAAIIDAREDAFDENLIDESKHNKALLQKVISSIPRYGSLEEALKEIEPDIVINVASNNAHIDIIREIHPYETVRSYLTEKPLVENVHDSEEAARLLQSCFVSMNMVTNFSAAAQQLKEWHEENPQWKLVGIEGTWGKDRRSDKRPTVGIAADIVHPAGLIQSIFQAKSWNLAGKAQGLYGTLAVDRNGDDIDCVYHYSAKFNTSAAPVIIDCSYAWKMQRRCVTAFFELDGNYIAAELFLDEMREGDDQRRDFVRFSKIHKDSFKSEFLFEGERSTQDKLETFLEKSFEAIEFRIPAHEMGLVGLEEEQAIGEVYGLLHPSSVWEDLQADPNLQIWDASPDAPHTPKRPEFPTIAESTPEQLRQRISRFGKLFEPSTPMAVFEDRISFQP